MKFNCDKKIIILISVDCLRADVLEKFPNKGLLKKYGNSLKMPKTKTFNSLIENGIFFTECFTASSYTTSSHASIFTGKYPIKSGVQEYFRTKIVAKTIFEIVKENFGNECATIFFTDYPIILGKYLGFNRKIDSYYTQNENKAIDVINKEKDKKHIISFFHFSDVHTPYGFSRLRQDNKKFAQTVKDLVSEYNIKTDRENQSMDWPEKKYGSRENRLRNIYHKAIEKMYERKEYNKLMQMYLDGVEYFDNHRFYNFINELKKQKIYNRAIFFIFADHGERWYDDSHGHHDNLYDDTIRVPLMVINPELGRGIRMNKQIRTIDIAPSVAKLLDIEGVEFDGEPLFPLVDKKSRIAIGEIWTSSNIDSIKRYIRRTIRKNCLDGYNSQPTDGYLWKEYARYENKKIINTYNQKGRKTTDFYTINDGIEIVVAREKPHDYLLENLNYYRGKQSESNKDDDINVSKQLKVYFNSLGYNV